MSIGRLDLTTLPRILTDLGITSLMVEGGAQIIHQFLAASSPLVDLLVVTVAPVLVPEGVGIQGGASTVSFPKQCWIP